MTFRTLTVATLLLLGCLSSVRAWAFKAEGIVQAGAKVAEMQTLLAGSEGRATLARVLGRPGAADELAQILGAREAGRVKGDPEAARAALLRKLEAVSDPAVIDRAAKLLGMTGDRAAELGKRDENLERMKKSVAEDGGSSGGTDVRHLDEIKAVIDARIQKGSKVDAEIVSGFFGAARLHPEWIGTGLARDCGAAMDDTQLTNFMVSFASTRLAKTRQKAVQLMSGTMVTRQSITSAEAQAAVCAATQHCQYVNLPEACR